MVQLEQVQFLFEQRNARLVGISADPPVTVMRTHNELGITFTLLPDDKRRLIRLYDHRERFSQLNIHNPAVYIVDHEGIVRYAYFGEHAADRPSPAEILQALDRLQQGD